MNADPMTPPDIAPREVVPELKKHILVDGFQMVVDLERSLGSRLYDAATDRSLVDLYGFYASMPLGFNHPYFKDEDVREDLLKGALTKVANSDVYTSYFARFVQAFSRVAGMPPMDRYFFVEGGALAVENALKAAMDWKVQKNIAAGRGEIGTDVIHFKQAFHGRSGYTMSLTNTDPNKVKYFAKFDWPRVHSPFINFALSEPQRTTQAVADEKQAEAEIMAALRDRPHRICSIILEPIQGEGGDNHFRGEWFRTLRRICDENDILLIFDEVQSGMGITGRTWCCQHFGVMPDLLCFGKKVQVCGVMAGPRLDEVPDNVFRKSGRINSTWGGNLCDMVRSTHYLTVIERDGLIDNAQEMGMRFMRGLQTLSDAAPEMIFNARGRGLMLAFTMTDADVRNAFWKGCFELGLLVIRSGERSIRLRPYLDVSPDIVDESIGIMRRQLERMRTH